MDLKYLFNPISVLNVEICDKGDEYYKYHWGVNPLLIPLMEDLDDQDFGITILSAATDRNIVVYDNYAYKGEMTPRLFQLMQCVQYENSDRGIDFFFYPENQPGFGYNFIPIKLSEYRMLKDYYLNTLQGTFASNDNDFVLGISLRKGSFVNPAYKNKQGIAVMDNSQLLLGSF